MTRTKTHARGGQAGLEMLAVTALLMTFFILVIAIYADESDALSHAQVRAGAQQVCQRMALIVDDLGSGPRYGYANYSLPQQIGGYNYTVNISTANFYAHVDTVDKTGLTRPDGTGCELRTINITNLTGGNSVFLYSGNNVSFIVNDLGIMIG